MLRPSRRRLLATSAAGLALSRLPALAQDRDTEWRYYGGNLASQRYAPLDQINASNFSKLEVAWRFKPDALGARREFQYEATPLLVKGELMSWT